MKITLDKKDRYSILSIHEQNLNSLIAPDLKSEFVFLRNEGIRNLILDMSEVEYVDSSGLSSVLTANRLWKDYGQFIIAGDLHANVQKLIKISRLDSILTIIPTISEAEDFVVMSELEQDLATDGDDD